MVGLEESAEMVHGGFKLDDSVATEETLVFWVLVVVLFEEGEGHGWDWGDLGLFKKLKRTGVGDFSKN